MPKTTWTLLTPPSQGAIAILQLSGEVQRSLTTLTGRDTWHDGDLHLVHIDGIDEAVAVKLDDTLAQIMPHGGLHVLRKLAQRFASLQLHRCDVPRYKEAEDQIEEAMLRTLAIAESPLAIELLLAQPPKLRGTEPSEEDLARSERLNHLIFPPKVVFLGAPNTGKSTLMNAMTRRDTSIVHDLPGATRDAVGARVNCSGVVVDLYDLPGFRDTCDPIEQDAISLARTIAREAAMTVLIADEEHDWIKTATSCTLLVGTKSDIARRGDAEYCVSAHTGEGLRELSIAIGNALVPQTDRTHDGPWFFAGLPDHSPIEE